LVCGEFSWRSGVPRRGRAVVLRTEPQASPPFGLPSLTRPLPLRCNKRTDAGRIFAKFNKSLDESGKSGQVERMRGVICPAFVSTILEKKHPEKQKPATRAGFYIGRFSGKPAGKLVIWTITNFLEIRPSVKRKRRFRL
jgi:hypothetical protein